MLPCPRPCTPGSTVAQEQRFSISRPIGDRLAPDQAAITQTNTSNTESFTSASLPLLGT
jgi:hypothetical protein